MKLTDKFVEAFKVEEGQERREVADSVQHGLRLRVNKAGAKTWSVQKTINGQRRRFTIGDYPTFSLKHARTRAGKMLVAAISDGHDPVKEKRIAREKAKTGTTTLEDAIKAFEKHLPNTRYARANVRNLRAALATHLKKPPSELNQFDLTRILDAKKNKTPTAANRLAAAFKVFFKWLSRRDKEVFNVAENLAKPWKEQARERVLTMEEVKAIWNTAPKLVESSRSGVRWDIYIKLLVLTAQRREEVASMRWEHLDLDNALWNIPSTSTKNKAAHIVPLTGAAVTLLKQIGPNSGLVFTTTGETAVSGFSKIKARLDKASGVKNWRLHDLRRTAVSHMADHGVDAYVADRVLNHIAASTLGTVARVYQRSEMLAQRREALNLWAEIVLSEE